MNISCRSAANFFTRNDASTRAVQCASLSGIWRCRSSLLAAPGPSSHGFESRVRSGYTGRIDSTRSVHVDVTKV